MGTSLALLAAVQTSLLAITRLSPDFPGCSQPGKHTQTTKQTPFPTAPFCPRCTQLCAGFLSQLCSRLLGASHTVLEFWGAPQCYLALKTKWSPPGDRGLGRLQRGLGSGGLPEVSGIKARKSSPSCWQLSGYRHPLLPQSK